MDSTMWSKIETDFQMLVGGTPGRRKLSFRVGNDLTLFMEKDEVEQMVAKLSEGLELVRQQIVNDNTTEKVGNEGT